MNTIHRTALLLLIMLSLINFIKTEEKKSSGENKREVGKETKGKESTKSNMEVKSENSSNHTSDNGLAVKRRESKKRKRKKKEGEAGVTEDRKPTRRRGRRPRSTLQPDTQKESKRPRRRGRPRSRTTEEAGRQRDVKPTRRGGRKSKLKSVTEKETTEHATEPGPKIESMSDVKASSYVTGEMNVITQSKPGLEVTQRPYDVITTIKAVSTTAVEPAINGESTKKSRHIENTTERVSERETTRTEVTIKFEEPKNETKTTIQTTKLEAHTNTKDVISTTTESTKQPETNIEKKTDMDADRHNIKAMYGNASESEKEIKYETVSDLKPTFKMYTVNYTPQKYWPTPRFYVKPTMVVYRPGGVDGTDPMFTRGFFRPTFPTIRGRNVEALERIKAILHRGSQPPSPPRTTTYQRMTIEWGAFGQRRSDRMPGLRRVLPQVRTVWITNRPVFDYRPQPLPQVFSTQRFAQYSTRAFPEARFVYGRVPTPRFSWPTKVFRMQPPTFKWQQPSFRWPTPAFRWSTRKFVFLRPTFRVPIRAMKWSTEPSIRGTTMEDDDQLSPGEIKYMRSRIRAMQGSEESKGRVDKLQRLYDILIGTTIRPKSKKSKKAKKKKRKCKEKWAECTKPSDCCKEFQCLRLYVPFKKSVKGPAMFCV